MAIKGGVMRKLNSHELNLIGGRFIKISKREIIKEEKRLIPIIAIRF